MATLESLTLGGLATGQTRYRQLPLEGLRPMSFDQSGTLEKCRATESASESSLGIEVPGGSVRVAARNWDVSKSTAAAGSAAEPPCMLDRLRQATSHY